jgi:hypothetical protein
MKHIFLLLSLLITIPVFLASDIPVNGVSICRERNKIQNCANLDSIKIKSQNVRIVFWNVENLYDPYDDTTRLDDEFTPAGAKHWTYAKFIRKLNQVAKMLLSIGQWSAPSVVGLCEVENRYVLNKLIHETPLKSFRYRFIHHESPDLRGVDVALLYRSDHFKVLSNRCISIRFPFDTLSQTREILLVKGLVRNRDTLILIVNHWPSRRGGYLSSQPRRIHVARVLRNLIDSIQHIAAEPGCYHPGSPGEPTKRTGRNPANSHGMNPGGQGTPVILSRRSANIVIMGDFNDEPEDESIRKVLNARCDTIPVEATSLYNLMGIRNRHKKEGTLKYRDQWSTFDQFIVTGSLLKGLQGLSTGAERVAIFHSTFLLETDKTYFGDKLNRTFVGPRYHGGFSDHLPVMVDIRQVE